MSSLVNAQTIAVAPMNKRTVIQKQILALAEQIRDLSQALNELTPIGRLLPELLVEIFSHLRWDRSWARGGQVPYMLKIAHVSHLWRAVALDCSSLWNQIFFSDEAMVREWLKRSRSSELSVSLDGNHSRDVAQIIYSQLHRIRQLEINLESWGPMARDPYLLQFPDVPLTELSVLSIQGTTSNPTVLLPFLSRSFPALRDLSIRSCGSVNLCSEIFTDLTVLHVVSCSISLSILDMLSQLEKMGRLEDLKLSTVSLLHGIPQEIVKLPHLSRFEYHGTDGNLDTLLLSQLRLAEESTLKLHFVTSISESSESLASSPTLSMLFAIFSRFWKGPPLITELNLNFQGNMLRFQTSNTQVHIHASGPLALEVYDRYTTWMSEHLSLFKDLKVIRIIGTTNERFWAAVSELSTLHSIHTHGRQNGEVLNILVENWRRRKATPGGETKPGLVFPNLEKIILEEVDFKNVSRKLINSLKRRSKKKKLQSLVLKNCWGMWDGLVRRLHDVVEHVDLYDSDSPDDSDDDSGSE